VPPLPERPEARRWLWTSRAGFEPHLFEELSWAKLSPRALGPGLVESRSPGELAPTFARVGFEVLTVAAQPELSMALERAAADLRPDGRPVYAQGWAPDVAAQAAQNAGAAASAAQLGALLPASQRAASAEDARARGGLLAQVCATQGWVAVGKVLAQDALSLAPGGRGRMRREEAPSRAGMKLDEALEWLGMAPGRGELCVDLGAAPGGWTERLVARGARVIAVDPAKLTPELTRHPKVRHVQRSAFEFSPEEAADWLLCDMAWRPLEVAQLLAKWARRRWASQLVANLKLPMKDKNPTLWRARRLLEEGGWRKVRVRQLYHDRDEVTVLAWR
jgi:23S rRNA (cytidine2498-2'-O)-methyltransferase